MKAGDFVRPAVGALALPHSDAKGAPAMPVPSAVYTLVAEGPGVPPIDAYRKEIRVDVAKAHPDQFREATERERRQGEVKPGKGSRPFTITAPDSPAFARPSSKSRPAAPEAPAPDAPAPSTARKSKG